MPRPPGKPPGSSGPLIDALPEAIRSQIVDALIAGASLRSVAAKAGISHVQVGEYKRKVILPAIRAAQKMNALQQVVQTTAAQTISVSNLTRAQVVADPVLARVERQLERRDKVLQKAFDDDNFKDWCNADRNDISATELWARLLGRLDNTPSVSVNFISLHQAPDPEPATLDILPLEP